MDENRGAAKAKYPRNEIRQLIERCKAMEKELDDLRKRMVRMQRHVLADNKDRSNTQRRA